MEFHYFPQRSAQFSRDAHALIPEMFRENGILIGAIAANIKSRVTCRTVHDHRLSPVRFVTVPKRVSVCKIG